MSTEVKTTVPGNMWKVLVKEGDAVKKGDILFIMEVMKTEVHHDSPVDGKEYCAAYFIIRSNQSRS